MCLVYDVKTAILISERHLELLINIDTRTFITVLLTKLYKKGETFQYNVHRYMPDKRLPCKRLLHVCTPSGELQRMLARAVNPSTHVLTGFY